MEDPRSLWPVVLVSVSLLFSHAPPASATGGESPQACDFSLPDILHGGDSRRWQDFEGKVVLLNIWASWCAGCKKEMPMFMDLQKSYQQSNFTVVAVTVDSREEKALSFLKSLERKTGRRVNFTVLHDSDKALTQCYKPRGLPATYLIGAGGRVAREFYGSFDSYNVQNLTQAIDQALKGDP